MAYEARRERTAPLTASASGGAEDALAASYLSALRRAGMATVGKLLEAAHGDVLRLRAACKARIGDTYGEAEQQQAGGNGPLDAAELDRVVAVCDTARESTFQYLDPEHNPDGTVSLATDAYALTSLQWAEAVVLRAHIVCTAEPSCATCKDAEAQAMRAADLALLRGGVVEWRRYGDALQERVRQLRVRCRGRRPGTAGKKRERQVAIDESAQGRKRARVGTVVVGERDVSLLKRDCPSYVHAQEGREDIVMDIERVDGRMLTTKQFKEQYLSTSRPVVIRNAMEAWPAMGGGEEEGSARRCWNDLEYLKEAAGDRLVPVEVYRECDATQTYLASSWEQRVMKLSDYIDDFVVNGGRETGERAYLAQHALFDQIESLRGDIIRPKYCEALLDQDVEAPSHSKCEQITNAWFGPSGTVSPLHHDPYHNLLCQVVGYKYVRLYAVECTGSVYPRSGAQCNNSFVDIDNVDEDKFPLFAAAPFFQCILGPGEMLYIPRHYWHYVRSLTVSFSVSCWWGARMALLQKPNSNEYYSSY